MWESADRALHENQWGGGVMRSPITKQALREFVGRLAEVHFEQCPHGYMRCTCKFSAILRDMIKAAEDQRGNATRKRLAAKSEKAKP